MAMTQYTGEVDIIAGLGTTPQERGLTADQFKAKFDKAFKDFKAWFNTTHKSEFDALTMSSDVKIIESKTLSSSASQVDFITNLSGYKKYTLYGITKGTTTTNRSIYAKLNDLSSGYAQVETKASGTTTTVATSSSNSAYILTNALADSTIGLGIATFEIEIYKITSGQYSFKSKHLTFTTGLESYKTDGYLGNSGALTKISLVASADAFAANSVFVLIGTV